MKKLMTVLAVVGVVTFAGLAWAGSQDDRPGKGPGGGGPEGNPGRGMGHVIQNADLAKSLGVTDEQRAKLRESSYELRKKTIQLEADQELARLEVNHLMDQEKPDREALNKAVEEAGRVETELQKVRIQQRLTTEEVLGEETLANIREYMRKQMQERDGKRPERRDQRGHGRGEWRKGKQGGEPCGAKAPAAPADDDDDDDDGDDDAPPAQE
ncbi:MAG: hypothetical protein BWK77_06585 [Verrucomicrobia bacterium A1]|nr:MAG: hypothetical protein BWK77_06585 [Verrucomicrobia bacterium A1]